MPRPLSTPGKDPGPIVQEAGWAPGPVWTGAEILASTGIRSPDRPARSQSLYRLSYRAQYDIVIEQYCWSQWPRGLRRRSAAVRVLELWVRIPPGHRSLFVLNVLCCQVEVCATSLSLVQRSPTALSKT
jgi:hypothetical protein